MEALPLPCIILNGNRRTKNGGGGYVNILVIANDVPPFQAQVPLNRPSVMQHHWALKYVSPQVFCCIFVDPEQVYTYIYMYNTCLHTKPQNDMLNSRALVLKSLVQYNYLSLCMY